MTMAPSVTREFRLRVIASGVKRPGAEISISGGVATIGRDEACTVVLNEISVSREHARIEQLQDGFRLTDLDSSNGVWVGETRVAGIVLTPRQTFRIGSTVLECLPAEATAEATVFEPPSDRPAVTPRPSPAFLVRVTFPGEDSRKKEFAVNGESAVVGRGKDCEVVLDAKNISRRHVQIESASDGFRITDLESANGVWIDDKRVEEPTRLEAGEQFRLGSDVFIECHLAPDAQTGPFAESKPAPRPLAPPAVSAKPPPPKPDPPAPSPPVAKPVPGVNTTPPVVPAATEGMNFDASQTIVMPAPAALLNETRRIQDEGEAVELSANQPFLIDDPKTLWYVVSGGVEIFTIAVKQGRPAGGRTHFLGILPGQCFFGLDTQSYGMGSGFLAVGKPGTKLRKIPVPRLRKLATESHHVKAVAGLMDTWVAGLAKSLVRDMPRKEPDVTITANANVSLESEKRTSAADGVVWLDTWSGGLLFDDMATPTFNGKRTLFPITPDSWVQPVGDEFGEVSLTPLSTERAVDRAALWDGLQVFHQVLCECEFLNKKLATVDEFIRLKDKAHHVDAAHEAAYDAIGAVLRTGASTPKEFLATGDSAPVVQACKLVGDALGMEVKANPEATEDLTYEEQIAAISSSSGFRNRVVALRGEWWTRDHGPLLGQIEGTQRPVALLPIDARSWELVDGKTGQRSPLTEELARKLSPFAYTFYRPFPEGTLSVIDLVRFGARGLESDLWMLIFTGITVGLFGTLTPYFIGRIFDSAIPQADGNMLWSFGFGLFASALAGSLFKFTQGVATVRLQGKMEYAIQSALWNRLLDLPTTFFRKHSAGDLADRAAGVDAIQNLVAGAGIGAVLGSLSGLFYVLQMFTYDLQLALAAIALTVGFISVTSIANFMQLHYQRIELQMRGRITGLVLNLITGVTKLRISGAEPHAFHIWAQKFAEQRKISFSIGRIQNAVTVFNSVFPILSSIVLFLILLNAQAAAEEAGTSGITTGDFIAFSAAYGLFLAAMQALADASLNMLRVVPIYERLKPILTTPAEADRSKVYPGKLKGEIAISRLHFRYQEDGPWVLKDLSLKIKPGELVAFVGSSGCGKSTLMRLLLGFEMPTTGGIYYDGQDISSLDVRMLRRQLGVVLQVSRVMPADIYRNIVGASSRTLDEAWEAAEAAGLAADIRVMPMGMHTYVAEGGGTLSGGQRQRLLIARAIVNKPKVLFLDEATSALDNRTQATVTESMDRLDATRIVIAHRLSTIIHADKICYLEDGRIAEMGTAEELIAKDGLFAQLARRQQT